MRRSQTFGTDNHTHAGRQHLIEMMLRHQLRLKDIAEGKQERPKGRQLYNGMNTTQTIDNSTPRTYILSRQLESKGDKRRSQWRQHLQQHNEQLDKSRQRIATYPTPTERRANRFDPIAHPVQFKRSHASSPTPAAALGGRGRVERDIMYSTGATRSQRYYYAHPITGRLLPRQEYDSAQLITQQMDANGRQRKSAQHTGSHREASARPATAGELGRRNAAQSLSVYEQKEEMQPSRSRAGSRHADRFSARPHTAQPSASATSFSHRLAATAYASNAAHRSTAPFTTGVDYDSDDSDASTVTACSASASPYDQLYSTLMSLLLAHRIVSADGIEKLLARAAAVNEHLDRLKVEWVCEAVREEMKVEGRTGDRRRAWQDEGDEERQDSDDEEVKPQEERAEEEAEDDDVAATESELQSLGARPFYERPPRMAEAIPPRPTVVDQSAKAEKKKEPALQTQALRADVQQHQRRNNFPQPDTTQQQSEPSQASATTEKAGTEQATEEIAPPSADEWYEDDSEAADQPAEQPAPAEDAPYEKEMVRAASGTHTIEEGEEDEEAEEYEREYEEEEKEAVTETQTGKATGDTEQAVEAASEDEYGDESYEADEQYDNDFF